MAEITLNSFTETLDVLIDANPHARNKGDELRHGAKTILGVMQEYLILKTTADYQPGIRAISLFCSNRHIRLCHGSKKMFLSYILERVYKQLENVAIIGRGIRSWQVDYKLSS